MKRPIILLLISFLAGFFCYEKVQFDISFLILAIFIFGICFIKWMKYSLVCLFVFIFAFNYTAYLNLSSLSYEDLKVKDMACKVVEKRKYPESNSYVLKIKKSVKAIHSSKHEYEIGDILVGDLEFSKPKSTDNFKAFSYRQYLKSKKVFLSAKGNLSKTGKKAVLLTIKGYFSDYIEKNIDRKLSGNFNEFAKSIVLGRNMMDKEINDKYMGLGIGHLLAVSGLHISIIIYFLDMIAKFFNVKRQAHLIFVVALLLFYGYMIGFPVSLMRALIMFFVKWLAIYLHNIYDKLNSILLAFFVCLLVNPYYLYSSSLYLSFAAIFSVMYLSDLLRYNLRLNKVRLDGIINCLSIQIGMFPIQIYLNNKINLFNILANLIIIPLAFIPVLSSFVISLSPINFMSIAINLLTGSVYLIDKLVEKLSMIEYISVAFSSFNIIYIILYYAFIVVFLNLYRMKKADRKLFLRLCLGVSCFIFISKFIVSNIILCRVNFIDVGQGDAILFRSKNHNFMVDVGGNFLNKEKSEKDLVSYLYKNGVYSLDGVFLTHDDFDHVGNFHYLSEKVNVKNMYAISKFESINEKLISFLRLNEVLEFDKVRLKVLSGNRTDFEHGKNESSLGMRAEISGFSILLTGDIEKEEMKLSMDDTDILKVGHHGSKNATSKKFLEAIRPKIATISAGQGNRYGHPHKDVLKRLKNHNVKIYSTIEDGNIEIIFLKDFYIVKTFYGKRTLVNLLFDAFINL